MKIKYLSTLLFGLFASLTVSAQQQKEFTLEDLNFGGKNFHNMVPKNRYCTWWGDQLVRQDASECYLVDKSTGKETKLFSVNEINQWISNTKDIKVRSLYNAQFPNADRPEVVLGNGSKIYVVDFKKHSLVSSHEIGEGDNVLEMNYKSGAMAVLRDNNLFMRLGTASLCLGMLEIINLGNVYLRIISHHRLIHAVESQFGTAVAEVSAFVNAELITVNALSVNNLT
jgi:dipeptidyl-peptidase 4